MVKKKQRAIFLDRDGVLNKPIIFKRKSFAPRKFKDFVIYPNVAKYCKLLKKNFLLIVVTNQPAVAKGFCSFSDTERIHMHMETELAKKRAKLDQIFFCPCHPDKGFAGENLKYKRNCNCRKPKIGMLDEAKKRYNLDFSSSYIIGDMTRDILTGKNAGVKSFLVNTGYAGKDGIFDVLPDNYSENLYSAVEAILS